MLRFSFDLYMDSLTFLRNHKWFCVHLSLSDVNLLLYHSSRSAGRLISSTVLSLLVFACTFMFCAHGRKFQPLLRCIHEPLDRTEKYRRFSNVDPKLTCDQSTHPDARCSIQILWFGFNFHSLKQKKSSLRSSPLNTKVSTIDFDFRVRNFSRSSCIHGSFVLIGQLCDSIHDKISSSYTKNYPCASPESYDFFL